MKNKLEILRNIKLFEEVGENFEAMLQCLGSEEKNYIKGEIIILTGNPVSSVGILLSGEIQIIQEDYMGNRSILTELKPGHIFGETFACAGVTKSPVTVLATADSTVLFIGIQRIITTCPSSCRFHNQLIENLLKIIARKNMLINRKNQLLSLRTIRDKVLSYLSLQAEKKGCPQFEISYTRNELADFLCVDRSALSRVLSTLKTEGIIDYHNKQFKLL
ncbi:MAG: Crp/Fnr family transcriptional regulator [Eubacteriaceae bacterium]|nr:Crp/Fnr family transcriptional regulator [Eubacteriaceae bacterium]